VHVHISKVYGYQSQVYTQLFLHFSKDLFINNIHAQIQSDCRMRNGFGTHFTDHTFWLLGGAGPLQMLCCLCCGRVSVAYAVIRFGVASTLLVVAAVLFITLQLYRSSRVLLMHEKRHYFGLRA